MTYDVIRTHKFDKALSKLDRHVQRRILVKLYGLCTLEDPSVRCKPMTGPLEGLWHIRTGDYRTIIDMRRGELAIVALDTDHRSAIYEG
ncbi:type II toxin-antitoxin system RelE/ParE family toxin [Brevibacterium sp.]|uniref:type II toxin-antitoxin system RelE family toxin n=1 Tax=Brevibacterium sp. TaxID=1701 RepID=UPI0025BDD1F1|nr:type II toxin-antitoxin system RelE/ParE family toxin [Brevibacterium sp.]